MIDAYGFNPLQYTCQIGTTLKAVYAWSFIHHSNTVVQYILVKNNVFQTFNETICLLLEIMALFVW